MDLRLVSSKSLRYAAGARPQSVSCNSPDEKVRINMGRQVNFFLHKDDEEDFDKFLKSFGDVVLLPYHHYDNKTSIIPDTILRNIQKEGGRVFLVQPEHLKDIKLHHIKKFDHWLLDESSLPILHYDRCISRPGEIQSGRLYFEPKFVANDAWQAKPDAFVKWADKIINSVRRNLKKHQLRIGEYTTSAYLGNHAGIWTEKNKAILQPGGHLLTSTM